MRILNRFFAISTISIALTASQALACEPHSEEAQQGTISYVSGGIGECNTEEVRGEREHYALHIVNADVAGEFEGTTKIKILDTNGYELLSDLAGPLFYANLPAGKYTVIEKADDRTQVKSMTIKANKPTNLRFNW